MPINQSNTSENVIVHKIHLVRGKKVMLDRDLAGLYDIKAIRLREQVKRNPDRFPANFMFRLTEMEVDFMVSQKAIPSKKSLGGHLPYVFTEHGVLMLANVLKSDKAVHMSIRIIEVFVQIREMLLTQDDTLKRLERIERKLADHDEIILSIFDYYKEMEKARKEVIDFKQRKRIGFKPDLE